ncbi:hypothetical protein [Sulfobacillus thermosulfidooxidans]|uniref:hypothetical protein n=1 Tax=Sulfobacillus thermosulfidooxidans TaxID=28034 RepID=UPI0002D97451|nr:hypothetical protein [Sulfobacillus thermosulfidooxidans]
MRGWTKLIKGLGITALALLVMLGQFWILYLAPLLIFVGMGITYGFLSSKQSTSRPSITPDSRSLDQVPHQVPFPD